MTHALTLEQKESLYDDGYVVLKNAVSQELVDAAIDRIRNPEEGVYAGGTKELTDLVNASTVTPILYEAMGYFDPPIVCQVGANRVRKPGNHFNNLGYRDKDQPYYGRSRTWTGCAPSAYRRRFRRGRRRRSTTTTSHRAPRATSGAVPRSWATTACRCSKIPK